MEVVAQLRNRRCRTLSFPRWAVGYCLRLADHESVPRTKPCKLHRSLSKVFGSAIALLPFQGVRIALIFMLTFSGLQADEASLKRKRALLEEAAKATKLNVSRINTWKISYEFSVETTLRGEQAEHYLNRLKQRDAKLPLLERQRGRYDAIEDLQRQRLFVRMVDSQPLRLADSTGRVFNTTEILPKDRYYIATRESLLEFSPNRNEAPSVHRSMLLPKEFPALSAVVYEKARSKLPEGSLWPTDVSAWTGDVFDPRTLFGHDRPVGAYLEMYIETFSSPDEKLREKADSMVEVTASSQKVPSDLHFSVKFPDRVTEIKFSANSGFNPVRFSSFRILPETKARVPVREIDWKYRVIDGINIPETIHDRRYHTSSGEMFFDRTLTLASCEINVPVNDKEFSFEALPIADGTRFRSEFKSGDFYFKGKEPFLPAKLQESYNEEVAPKKSRTVLLIVVNSIFLLTLLLIVLYRRRRKSVLSRGSNTESPTA